MVCVVAEYWLLYGSLLYSAPEVMVEWMRKTGESAPYCIQRVYISFDCCLARLKPPRSEEM